MTEYEPGKKIKVVGPGDKDVSFELDKSVTVNGAVAVGQRVKSSTPGPTRARST